MGSNDSFRETSSQSWFSRLGDSIKGVLFGLLLFIAAFPLLFWNEGKAVRVAQDLAAGKGAVISLTEPKVDSSKEGKLIHFSGDAATQDTITDPVLGISEKAIRIIRNVQMYQWKEESTSRTEKKLGGGTETVTEYKYVKEWSSSVVNSSSFKKSGYNNPASMEVESGSVNAQNVTVGDFSLPSGLINQITQGEKVQMTDQSLASLPANFQGRAKVVGNEIYIGSEPSNPQIGDLKIDVTIVRPQKVTVIAKQQGNTLVTQQGEGGTDIFWLRGGVASATEMFQAAESSNVLRTWLFRLGGFLMMFIGIGMILKPIVTFGDVVPIIGSILNFGTSIAAFVVALIFTLLTIAIAWLAARPIIGIALLVIVVGAFVAFRVLGKKKQPQAAA